MSKRKLYARVRLVLNIYYIKLSGCYTYIGSILELYKFNMNYTSKELKSSSSFRTQK